MEQLSSCYFCGAALDASLDEYPVVPKDLHPTTDDQKTVVLCQGCRQKLGTVVETIVSVVESPESADPADDRTPDPADSSADEDPLADEGWVDAGELSASDDAGEAAAAADGHATGNASTEETDADADDGSDDVTYTTSTAAGGRRSVSGNAESIRDDDGPAGGDERSAGGSAANDGAGASGTDGGGNGGEAGDGRPSMTALENTKVMRLLQNREFPVDRAEIKAVAVNAYDMSESQFDKVVDAAVDRGLIGEQNGQIVDGN
ncbi:hypothetical protein OB920_13000 [Halobacteria archaeon HArc-gm2]|nr:hypothetical protein [Halobacteria archaeon HArc-gm2]